MTKSGLGTLQDIIVGSQGLASRQELEEEATRGLAY